MDVRTDPQWAEVKGMLEYVGAAGERRTGTLYSDEARLILKAIGKPETLDRDKIAFLIADLCEQHLQRDPELGICGTGSLGFAAADQIMTWVTGAELLQPDELAGILHKAFSHPDAVDHSAEVVGVPKLVRTKDGWYALGGDGTRFNLVCAHRAPTTPTITQGE